MQPRAVTEGPIQKQIIDFAGGSLRYIESLQAVHSCEAVFLPDYLLYHIIEGQKLFFSGQARWALNPGDTILIRRQAAVSCEAQLPDNTRFRALSVHLSRELLEDFVATQPGASGNTSATQNACILPLSPGFAHCIAGLALAFDPQAALWEALLNHRLQALLLHLFHPHDQGVEAVCAEVLSGRRREYLEMLNQAIAQPLATEAMAKIMGMSLSAFKREFNQIFKQTPARYLMQRRLERAQQLLLTTPEPVQNIAAGTGFENPSHFVQAFKRVYGQTPGEYREHWPRPA